MKTSSLRARTLACALLATTAYCGFTASPAAAQAASDPSPAYRNVDENGVDLVTGQMSFSLVEGSVGAGEGAVSLVRHWTGSAVFGDNWSGGLYSKTDSAAATTWYVELGGISDSFTRTGSTFVSNKGDGARLEEVTGMLHVKYRYTSPDGTQVDFRDRSQLGYALSGYACPANTNDCAIPVSITRPNGMKFEIRWTIVQKCNVQTPGCSGGVGTGFYRFAGVTSSAGYKFDVTYETDAAGNFAAPQTAWYRKTGIVFGNAAVPCGTACPAVTYSDSGGIVTVKDALNREWRFDVSTTQLQAIRRPGAASDSLVVTYSNGAVSQVVNEGVTTTYVRTVANGIATTVITNAAGSRTVTARLDIGRVAAVEDETGETTSYSYTGGRLTGVSYPEGNSVVFEHDSRGNVLKTRAIPKSGSGLTEIVTTASYPCSVAKACNRPESVTDARGNTTEFTYDPNHGGLLTATYPAPTTTGIRPQERFFYTFTPAPAGVPATQHSGAYLLTGTSTCQTTASCAGGTDEAKSSIFYNANMLPEQTKAGNGTGTLEAITAMTYDPAGNLLTVDGPLAGPADTSRFHYDRARQQVGSVSPDPDEGLGPNGSNGPLLHRAVRVAYNSDGQVVRTERGTVAGRSDSDWAGFVPLEASETSYDDKARPVATRLLSGSTVYALTETSYDGLNRVDCVAQRMNMAEFSTPPAAACAMKGSISAFGPDRIAKHEYDEMSRVTKVTTGFGTGDAADEVRTSFTKNGQVATVTDAENNKTTYEYDGHGRLWLTRFPVKAKGAGASSLTTDLDADYEQLTYESVAGGTQNSPLLASKRLRDGQLLGFGYDALGRTVSIDMPNSVHHEFDRTFAYDNLGRTTRASNVVVHTYFGYDALGRMIGEAVSYYGIRRFGYDLAGRRTKVTWSDNFQVDYDYNPAGDMIAVRENGATSGPGVLARFDYDALGRRTLLTRGNGTTTSYSYETASPWLDTLGHSFPAAPANDLTLGFDYNPAGQIVTNTRTNDLYSWTGHGSGTTATTANGLNQIAGWNGPIVYDRRGNKVETPQGVYIYTALNELTMVPNQANIMPDAMGRIHWLLPSSGPGRAFVHEGDALIAEYDFNVAMTDRYVHGPGVDEPLVWYAGSGTADRRWLHADERGSIVAVSDGSGSVIGINRYDEYGIPAATNIGRFQYTGQKWMKEFGLYNYKARYYDPRHGFMQADPIGYGDGLNMYAYAGGDPVNKVDPTGTKEREGTAKWIGDARNLGPIAGTVIGSRIDQAMRDTLASLAFIDINRAFNVGRGSNDRDPVVYPDIEVTGQRPEKPKLGGPAIIFPPSAWFGAQPPNSGSEGPARKFPAEDFCGSDEADLPEGVWAQACNSHDACYAAGVPKHTCDLRFARDILIDCSDATFVPAACLAPAWWGYLIVTFGGGPAYDRSVETRRRRR